MFVRLHYFNLTQTCYNTRINIFQRIICTIEPHSNSSRLKYIANTYIINVYCEYFLLFKPLSMIFNGIDISLTIPFA